MPYHPGDAAHDAWVGTWAGSPYCVGCDRSFDHGTDTADWKPVDDGGVEVIVCPACAATWADTPHVVTAPPPTPATPPPGT